MVDEISSADAANDTLKSNILYKRYKLWEKEMQDIRIDFIKRNPNTFVSLAQLNRLYPFIDKTISKELFNSLSPRLKNHSMAKELHYTLFELDKVLTEIVSFSQADTSETIINTKRFKGKYLLVDFWASWCGPCRAENPNIKKAYDKYKNNGFEIISVSLDNNKQSWKNAIKKDSLTWTHVSDLKGWQNEIALKYCIRSVPSNFLLDKDGKIIAKDLRGEALQKKISELFNQ